MKKGKTYKCKQCGKETYRNQSYGNAFNNKFCSQKCYAESLKTNKPTKCAVCGKEFYCSKSQQSLRGRKHCSHECYNKSRSQLWRDSANKVKKEKKAKDLLPRHVGKNIPLSTLIKKLDRVYSLYIRHREAKDGQNYCVTCGAYKPITELDCGHYVPRNHKSLRWDERNTWPQCRRCNRFQHGNMASYAAFLEKKYGYGILQTFEKERWVITKLTSEELKSKIDMYSNKVSQLGVSF